ncbi:hypothetical protein HY630_00935 [Candidatus Uhrbacteria bacterium]|nr:hypothetical protein [Candidatus Uhrbacteria bacterium]
MSSAPNLLPIPLSRTGRTLLLALDLVEGFMWKMLPSIRNEDDGKGGTKRVRVSKQDRIDFLKSRLVMSAENEQVPHMAGVDWRADVPKYATEVLIPAIKDGQYQYDGDGNVALAPEKRWPYAVRGQTKLPDGNAITVRPLVLCDGKGFLLPYVKPRQQQGEVVYDGVDGMISFLFRDFNPWTWEDILDGDKPSFRAVPAALARPETVARWNELVKRRGEQDKSYPVASELVTPIAHNQFGRRVLKYRPQGHPLVRDGMLGILKPPRDREEAGAINVRKDVKRWTLGDLVGKTLALGKGLKLIQPEKSGRFEPHKLAINEMWSWIDVEQVDGIWGAGTRVDQHVIKAEQDPIDALAALGLTLYSCSPFEVKGIVTRLLTAPITDDHPIIVNLRSRGDLEVDADEDLARRQMRAIETILVDGARGTIREARRRLEHELGGAGSQNPGINLEQALGAEPTPELLRQVHDNPTGDNLLVIGMLTSKTASDLGLTEWDPKCWVLVEAFKTLLLALAASAGIEMAPPPAPPEAPAVTEDQPPATNP